MPSRSAMRSHRKSPPVRPAATEVWEVKRVAAALGTLGIVRVFAPVGSNLYRDTADPGLYYVVTP